MSYYIQIKLLTIIFPFSRINVSLHFPVCGDFSLMAL